MGSTHFDAHSLWQKMTMPAFRALSENHRTQICVIGAGIAGLSVAYHLLRSRVEVIVLDRERLGLGETGLTSAHLSNALDDRYHQLERLHGREGARLAAESHTQAIAAIARIQARERIACDFRWLKGFLFAAPSSSLDELTRELAAAHRAGLSDVRLIDRAPVDLFDTGPCLEFPNQAQFHPLKYLAGLAEAVRRLGGKIFSLSEAVDIQGGKAARVTTRSGRYVDCDAIVVATNTPINNRLAIHSKNAAHRSYMIGLPLPPGSTDSALFWDTAEPYHYVRSAMDPESGGALLLVGGADHRTGQESDPEKHWSDLQIWTRDRLGLNGTPVIRWSGQILEPVDGLAYIGRNPGDKHNVYIITGDSGHGLTHAAIAGELLTDLILNRPNPWATLYDPARLHLKSLPRFVRDAVDSTVPYGDWLSEGDVDSVVQVGLGQGAVVREGLHKLAVYKDELGRLHSCSAVCPHLGGIVRWNKAEKTWDCPCHGSRFDRFGQVINGPANRDLEPAEGPLQLAEGLQI